MKHKAFLILLEQLIMLLVFALACAACLGIFARAHIIRRDTALRDQAVLLAQNTAERLKAGQELPDAGALTLSVTDTPSPPGLDTVRIEVFYEGRLLFTLDTGWQEGVP